MFEYGNFGVNLPRPTNAQYDAVDDWIEAHHTVEDIQRKCWEVAEGNRDIAFQLCREHDVPFSYMGEEA